MAGTCSWIGRFFFDSSHFFSMISFPLTKIKMFQRLGTIGWWKNHTKYEKSLVSVSVSVQRRSGIGDFDWEITGTNEVGELTSSADCCICFVEGIGCWIGSYGPWMRYLQKFLRWKLISALLWYSSGNWNRNRIRGVQSSRSSASVNAQGRDREEDRRNLEKEKGRKMWPKNLISSSFGFILFSFLFILL